MIKILATIAVLAAASFVAPQTMRAATIITGPTTITQPGEYELGNDIVFGATNGTIIAIDASQVTLDFKGFSIIGPNNPGQNVFGILAGGRRNITIKNGTIAFCNVGIRLNGNAGHRVENMRVMACYFFGIQMTSTVSAQVDHCLVTGIGGSTNFSGAPIAVDIGGNGSTVTDTNVSNVSASASASSGPMNTGIYLGPGSFAVENRIAGAFIGINTAAGSKFKDNLTSACGTPFTGSGTNVSGNN